MGKIDNIKVTDIRFKHVLDENKEYVIEEKHKRANQKLVNLMDDTIQNPEKYKDIPKGYLQDKYQEFVKEAELELFKELVGDERE